MSQQKEYRNHWSEDGQVFFCDGKGFGLTNTLKTICLGSEEDIKRYLETGQFSPQFNPLQRQVLRQILDYRKEQGIGTTDSTGTAGVERASYYGASRHKLKATRLPAIRKRLPLRPSRAKNTGVFS